MTEHTDKASHKSGKAAPNKRPGRSRPPGKKRAKTSGGKAASENQGLSPATGDAATSQPAESESLAPDPATISFGSNRPIVATPQKLPASSGLQFSGPSAGSLKASGPQPTSAKASGLTFTSAKAANPLSQDSASGAKDKASKAGVKLAEDKKPKAEKPEAAKPTAAKAGAENKQKKAAEKTETSKVAASGAPAKTTGAKPSDSKTAGTAKPTASTKPAIAPQASGRRLDKERSTSGFVATLVGLTVLIGGLTFWLNLGEQPAAPAEGVAAVEPAQEPAPAEIVAAAPAAIEEPAPTQPVTETVSAATNPGPELAPATRAPESPGPLVAEHPAPSDSAMATPIATPGSEAGLTAAEIGEIQTLLDRLGLAPGSTDGVLTGETTAAIRSYQEMAGLPTDGAVDKALLDELRAVVDLYGG